ncbi:MAG: hypothetical protein KY469_01625 [Actinobacteria bacterium]|nr:hypothetical protein [Actinomycetota bacterium]
MSITRRELLKAGALGVGAGLLAAAAPGRVSIAPSAPALHLVRVPGPVSGRQAAMLATLDDTHRILVGGGREFLLWPGDADALDAAGIAYDALDADVLRDARRDPGRSIAPQPGERDEYRIVDDYRTDLVALVEQFGPEGLARLIELPTPSLVGRTLWGIEIAEDVDRQDGRPVLYMDGLHHAREWPAGEMPIMWAHDLLEGHGTDPDMTHIVRNARTIIVPCVNPDGFVRSRMSPVQVDSSNDVFNAGQLALGISGQESYWRKNLRSFSGVNVDGGATDRDNPDAYGIDLNRNYPFLWGDNAGSSNLQVGQTYRGTAPYSEPVTHNVRDLFLAHTPIAAITHHTYGEIMLIPWGRNPAVVRSPDWDLMFEIGEEMQASNGYGPQQAFSLYATSGTSRDWGHAATSTIIYTFEHGTEFHGPYGSTIPQMYSDNRGAFITWSHRAIDPASHLVITGRIVDGAGNPVPDAEVALTKSFETPTAQGTLVPESVTKVVRAGADGRFELHAPPSTRPHLAEAVFGGPKTEPWLVAFGPAGLPTVPVEAGRGEVVDLDDVTI